LKPKSAFLIKKTCISKNT